MGEKGGGSKTERGSWNEWNYLKGVTQLEILLYSACYLTLDFFLLSFFVLSLFVLRQ